MHAEHQDPAPSKANFFGHPIHPMLIPFPIAFLCAAPVTDILYIVRENPFWASASFWLIAAGIATALLAALFGFIDFFGVPRVREHKSGWWHMVVNLAAVLFSVVNLVLRFGESHADNIMPVGVALSVIVAMLLGVSGWLGGELSYKHKIGVMR